MIAGVTLLFLQRGLHVGDGAGNFVDAVRVLVHQVLEHAHALVQRLLQGRDLVRKLLHLGLQLDQFTVNRPRRPNTYHPYGDSCGQDGEENAMVKNSHVRS